MTAPCFFTFTFNNETLQLLTNIRPCIITNIGVNYGASGVLESTMDGMPKFITVTISMAELRTIMNEQWGDI